MKIEKKTTVVSRPNSITENLGKLKPGQMLRITNARDAYVFGGSRGYAQKKLGKKFKSQIDGEDVVVFLKP